jgi:hypothetical protein
MKIKEIWDKIYENTPEKVKSERIGKSKLIYQQIKSNQPRP